MNDNIIPTLTHSDRKKGSGTKIRAYYLRIAFLVAIGVFMLLILGVLITLALPRPQYEQIGSFQEYPPRSEPYDLRQSAGYYLVNTGTEVIALNPRAPRRAGCWVTWDGDRGVFLDPCFGTRFDLTGLPVDGPPSPALGRYRVRIEDQRIWVSTSSTAEKDDADLR